MIISIFKSMLYFFNVSVGYFIRMVIWSSILGMSIPGIHAQPSRINIATGSVVAMKGEGYYQIKEVNGVLRFVDPDGRPFVSVGMYHLNPNLLNYDYNRHVFMSRYGGSHQAFIEDSCRELWDWGFNTISMWEGGRLSDGFTPPQCFGTCVNILPIAYWDTWSGRNPDGLKKLLPEIRSESRHGDGDAVHNNIYYAGFFDVFSDEWDARCREKVNAAVSSMSRHRGLMGYYYVDIPIWTPSWWNFRPKVAKHIKRFDDLFAEGERPSWTDWIRRLDGSSPGKRAFVEHIRGLYADDIAVFNAVYNTNFLSFDGLLEHTDFSIVRCADPERYKRDDLSFLGLIARRYYETLHKCVREADPHRLILGDRFDGDAGVPDEVLIEAGKYIDCFSLEYYQFEDMDTHIEYIKHFHKMTGKPVLLCDSSYSTSTEGLPGNIPPLCENRQQVGERYIEYFDRILELPFVVGWHWCGYIDRTAESEGPLQHSGLKDCFGNPYTEAVELIKAYNERFRVE